MSASEYGGLISVIIGFAFQKVETLRPEADHRYYLECRLCGGTDELRPVRGSRPSIDTVTHGGACTLAKYLPDLRALANNTDAPALDRAKLALQRISRTSTDEHAVDTALAALTEIVAMEREAR